MTRWSPRDGWGIAAAGSLAAFIYLLAHQLSPLRPLAAEATAGWWSWSDQFRYLRAATAWAGGDLDPAQHWYWPGYPLLAAPFVGLTPEQPFLIPDLLCLLASVWLCAGLARHILPAQVRARGSIGAAIFVVTAMVHPRMRDAWVVPWNSTASTPAALACLLAAAVFSRRPDWRAAALGGAALGLTGAIRPTDIVMPAVAWVVVGGWALAARALPGRAWAGAAIAGLCGALVPTAVAVGAHLAVHGPHASPYMRYAAGFGFELSLLAFRWATIGLSGAPVFPDGAGLVQVFPWFLPGVGGIVVCAMLARGGVRAMHLAFGAATAAGLVFYLCFRDLHATGLWRYHNYHYFKPVLPLLALYATALLSRAPTWRAGLAAAGLVAALLPWRGAERPRADAPVERVDAHTLRLPAGLAHVGDGVRVAATGSWEAIYFNAATLTIGEAVFTHPEAFKLFLDNETLVLMVLRDLPPGPAVLRLGPGVTLGDTPPPRQVVFRTRLALPWSGQE